MRAKDPVVTFLLVLVIGVVAGILFDRLAGPSWFARQFSGSTRCIITSALVGVPTISFRLLFGFLILRHDRREILWFGATEHPTAEWIARQLTEAFGWEMPPRYLVRDRDRAYGDVFVRRVRAMGIRDRSTVARSPWQNGYCERAIGSIRRDYLDHIIVFGEQHLRHLLRCYAIYYNQSRTHLSLNKDAPSGEPSMPSGASKPGQFSAAYTVNMFGFDLR